MRKQSRSPSGRQVIRWANMMNRGGATFAQGRGSLSGFFSGKLSGVAAKRPELERALDELEAGDALVVTKLDRLARSTLDLLRIVGQIGREGAGFKSLGEPWAG